ncbi:MAG: SDR family oxidoreductase [Chloroflexota bacterium]
MKENVLQGRTALVTGASSGLGAEFARQLAAMGCHLILVARRADSMEKLKEEIGGRHPVDVTVIPMDLAARDAPQALYDQVRQLGKSVDVLINNAGLGLYGNFLDIPWEKERAMLELDVIALTHLTRLFAQEMIGRHFGYILQIASIGAYQPSPMYASYSAAKSYVLYYSEAIRYELRKTNVSVTTLSPGVTRTEFHQSAGQDSYTRYQRLAIMESPQVAAIGLKAMLNRRPSVVAGRLNSLAAFLTRFTPRMASAAVAHRTMTVK